MKQNQHSLSEKLHQKIFEQDIMPFLFQQNITPQEHPVAVVLGGQPGAGKSAFMHLVLDKLNQQTTGGAITIAGDDFRPYHPDYASLLINDDKSAAFFTDLDTGRWVEKAIAMAKDQRVNLVIEGTMRCVDKVSQTMVSLRDAGYEVQASVLAVNPLVSEQGILLRYEQQRMANGGWGRMTISAAHQAAVDGLPVTIATIEQEKLAETVRLYPRNGEPIYENVLQSWDNHWRDPPCASRVLLAEQTRPFTPAEYEQLDIGFKKLSLFQDNPDRNISALEREKTVELWQRTEQFYSQQQDEPYHTDWSTPYDFAKLATVEPADQIPSPAPYSYPLFYRKDPLW